MTVILTVQTLRETISRQNPKSSYLIGGGKNGEKRLILDVSD